MRQELIDELAVTFEIIGSSTLSDGAKALIVQELDGYSPADVSAALGRCLREVKGRLGLSDIISRIPSGWPEANEAWSLNPKSESASTEMCTEIAASFAEATEYAYGDNAQRLAFREIYERRANEARNAGKRPGWYMSLGTDLRGREAALRGAVARGRITAAYAHKLLPDMERESPVVDALMGGAYVCLPEKVLTDSEINDAIKALPWERKDG